MTIYNSKGIKNKDNCLKCLWRVYRKSSFQAFSKIADFTYPLTIHNKLLFYCHRRRSLPSVAYTIVSFLPSPRMGRNFFTCRLRFVGLTVENTHRPLPYMFGIDHKKSKPSIRRNIA